jgi:hypothetical protein
MRMLTTRFLSMLVLAILAMASAPIAPAKAQTSRDLAIIMGVVSTVATIAATAHARQHGYAGPLHANNGYRPHPLRCPPGFQPGPAGFQQNTFGYGHSGYGPTGYGPSVYGSGPSRFDHDLGFRQGYGAGSYQPRHARQQRCVEIPGYRTGFNNIGLQGRGDQQCWTETRQVRVPGGVTMRRVRVCDEN